MLRIIVLLFVSITLNSVKADVNEELFQAARSGSVKDMQTALSSGAKINAEDLLGETALFYAIDECRTEAAKMLIDKGAKLDFLTKVNYTPLMKACAEGCLDIVQLLINEGVNVNRAEPKKKYTPLIKATQFNKLDVIKLLVENGAEIDLADKFGNTPLMIATQNDYVDIAEYFIEQGADVNAKTLIGYTPILYALELGRPEIADMLIEKGADIAVIDKYKHSTLMHAAAHGYGDIVETLVAKGVDVNLKTEKDETAAVLAQKKEFDDIVDYLLQNGADSTGLVFVDSAEVAKAEMIAEMYDTAPEVIGGLEAVQKRLRYPKDAKDNGLSGTVLLKVTVDKRGRVRDTEVIESFGDEECDQAAQRAVRNTRWKAAEKDSKKVEAWIEVPVEFKLDEE